MTRFYHIDPEDLWINNTTTGVPYVVGYLKDQWDDEDEEFIFADITSAPKIIEFLQGYMERHGK